MAIVLTYIGCDLKLAIDREASNRGQVKYNKIVVSIKIDRIYESCVLKFIKHAQNKMKEVLNGLTRVSGNKGFISF